MTGRHVQGCVRCVFVYVEGDLPVRARILSVYSMPSCTGRARVIYLLCRAWRGPGGTNEVVEKTSVVGAGE